MKGCMSDDDEVILSPLVVHVYVTQFYVCEMTNKKKNSKNNIFIESNEIKCTISLYIL